MNNQPLISIIVPCYNVEQYLPKCIESILAQTYRNLEILLVDDGSPDRCGEICDKYAKKDSRIKVIHKPNGGLAAARNSGQDAATGYAMMFVDSDDWLESDCCEKAMKAMLEFDVELVMFDEFVNSPHSQAVVHSFKDDKGCRKFVEADCRKLQARVLDFNGEIAMAFQKLIRMDYLRTHNICHINELRQGAEGFVFNIQLFEYLSSAYYLNLPLLHYRYNKQSISHTASVANNILIVRCMEWIDDFVRKSKNTLDLHAGVMNRLLYIICTTAITGYFNPYYQRSFKEKIDEFEVFMKEPLVDKAMCEAPRTGLNLQRKLILKLIASKQYRLLALLGWLRRKQLENK